MNENEKSIMSEFESLGIVVSQPEEVKEVEKEKIEVFENTENSVIQEDRQNIYNDLDSDNNQEDNIIKDFSDSLSYNGNFDKKDSLIESLKEIAKIKIREKELEYEGFDIDIVKQFKEHIENGYSVDSFIKSDLIENKLQDLEIRENNIEDAESIIRFDLEKKGVNEIMIDATVDSLKDSGKIFDVAIPILESLKEKEKEENESQRLFILENEKQEFEEIVNFFKGINSSINENNFNGVKLSENDLSTLKSISLPNENNEIQVNNILNSFTHSQSALLNFCAYKISKGESLNLNFSKPVNKRIEIDLLSKQSKVSNEKYVSVDDFRNEFKN